MAVSEGEIGRFTPERSGLEEMSISGLLRRVMAFSPLVLEQSGKHYISTLTKPVYRRAPRFCHSLSNSARLQKDFCVPTLVVDRAAKRFARVSASFSGKPSLRRTAKLPMKASPAPVVSTALTLKAGTISTPSEPATKEPRSPRVMTPFL